MLSTLKQPYPYYYTMDKLWKLSLLIMVIVAFFLFLFRPVGIDYNLRYDIKFTCLIYGSIAGVIFYLFYSILPKIFTSFFKTNEWTVFKELLALTILVFIIGIINYFMRDTITTSFNGFELDSLIEDVLNTFLIGIIPLSALTILNFFYLFNDNENKAYLSNLLLEKSRGIDKDKNSQHIQIQSIHDSISLDTEALYFIRADGNYAEFYVLNENSLEKIVKRIPLRTIEEQVSSHNNILRIHRAFLVNIDHIQSVTGNAQGYQLTFEHYDDSVPVSRSFIKQFNQVVNRN